MPGRAESGHVGPFPAILSSTVIVFPSLLIILDFQSYRKIVKSLTQYFHAIRVY